MPLLCPSPAGGGRQQEICQTGPQECSLHPDHYLFPFAKRRSLWPGTGSNVMHHFLWTERGGVRSLSLYIWLFHPFCTQPTQGGWLQKEVPFTYPQPLTFLDPHSPPHRLPSWLVQAADGSNGWQPAFPWSTSSHHGFLLPL